MLATGVDPSQILPRGSLTSTRSLRGKAREPRGKVKETLLRAECHEAQFAVAVGDRQQDGFLAVLLQLIDALFHVGGVGHRFLRHLDDDVAGAELPRQSVKLSDRQPAAPWLTRRFTAANEKTCCVSIARNQGAAFVREPCFAANLSNRKIGDVKNRAGRNRIALPASTDIAGAAAPRRRLHFLSYANGKSRVDR